MSDGIGTWSPESDPGSVPEVADLRAAVELWRRQGEAGIEAIPDDLATRLRPAMRLPRGVLKPRLAELHDAELVDLVCFFTAVEARHPDWEAGDRSPVIPLFAELKARSAVPDDLVGWIRARSDNRFLPHGSLQDRLGG